MTPFWSSIRAIPRLPPPITQRTIVDSNGPENAGIRELRTLVQRYPQTPEAQEGRSKLKGMGVRIYAAKPSAYLRDSP